MSRMFCFAPSDMTTALLVCACMLGLAACADDVSAASDEGSMSAFDAASDVPASMSDGSTPAVDAVSDAASAPSSDGSTLDATSGDAESEDAAAPQEYCDIRASDELSNPGPFTCGVHEQSELNCDAVPLQFTVNREARSCR